MSCTHQTFNKTVQAGDTAQAGRTQQTGADGWLKIERKSSAKKVEAKLNIPENFIN